MDDYCSPVRQVVNQIWVTTVPCWSDRESDVGQMVSQMWVTTVPCWSGGESSVGQVVGQVASQMLVRW